MENYWESKFFEVDMDDLHELFMAASYLEIESLLNGVAKRVADFIKACKNVEVIRQTFRINNDFAAQQEEEILGKIWYLYDMVTVHGIDLLDRLHAYRHECYPRLNTCSLVHVPTGSFVWLRTLCSRTPKDV
ncbi:hypothetical protein CXB51_024580 [Gossypium anomalum]|uniref:SKP1 component dimerisation domain-containing protein n=1 Tax=Gossypium anomalum TaxID=47600 RepID=A0A8J6CMM2_9ROSI|nr:hypothetical protein CXB51_024580 [Gossypium anomalum]